MFEQLQSKEQGKKVWAGSVVFFPQTSAQGGTGAGEGAGLRAAVIFFPPLFKKKKIIII